MKNRPSNIFYCAMAVAALFLISLQVQTARADDVVSRGQLSEKDYHFVTKAMEGGTMEITLGQMAVDKGMDQAVKDFGERMVKDHSKANQELRDLLAKKAAAVPELPIQKQEKMTIDFRNLSGAEFDRAFMKKMVSDHKKTIKLFQDQADRGDDIDLKNWAAQTLPTLQEHLRIALDVQQTIENKPEASLR